MILSPSLLSADFGRFSEAVQWLNTTTADWFHLDVMDGVFVPNITFGQAMVRRVKQEAQKPLDVHLMIVEPERYVDAFVEAGADYLSVHIEASRHLHRTLMQIRQAGAKAGVALNPHTPVSALDPIIADADFVLLMSVNPGFGGQSFIESTYRKLDQLCELRSKLNPSLLIELDGGVGLNNAARLKQAGVDAIVAGNAVFGAKDPGQAILDLKSF